MRNYGKGASQHITNMELLTLLQQLVAAQQETNRLLGWLCNAKYVEAQGSAPTPPADRMPPEVWARSG